jgi:hypothetical protein
MARSAMFLALAALLIGTCMGGRSLLTDPKDEYCTCQPYVETRTPDEICNARGPGGEACNLGGYFPLQGSDCSSYFTCVPASTIANADGTASYTYKATAVPCPAGAKFDVLKNTCTAPLFIDNKEVCTSKCLGFMYKPKDGCYNLASTNTGQGSWGLYNSGKYAVGCGNSGGPSVGVKNSAGNSAGCSNTGDAAWGIGISGSGSCVDGASAQNMIFTVDTLSG